MFEGTTPRLYGVAPGADFPEQVVAGLTTRMAGAPPEDWARVTVLVNSGRMGRRLEERLAARAPGLLPRLRPVTDLDALAGFPDVLPAMTGLQLQLELAALITRLIDADPGLAPRSAVFDMAESLAALLDEMHGEGVDGATLAGLDVGGHAAHWQHSRSIVEAAFDFFGQREDLLPGAEARRRRLVDGLVARWQDRPPPGPVIVAGSTGSRGTTRALMAAVARLPQGAVILPGFDFDQPEAVWRGLDRAMTGEDHPQYRFAALLRDLDLPHDAVRPWSDGPDGGAPDPGRNRLVSLALRPAPVTDAWRSEGSALPDPLDMTAGMTLIEAPSLRAEASAIALRLRQAVEAGQSAALVSPDRMLTRRVTAALDRWRILPDDSAGAPLHHTAPGRLLRQTAAWLTEGPSLAGLIALLKHPLVATGGDRGPHLRLTRELELRLRRKRVAQPDAEALRDWATTPEVALWAEWVAGALFAEPIAQPQPLDRLIARHIALTEALAAGPGAPESHAMGSGALWDEVAGVEARAALAQLTEAAPHADPMLWRDYARLLDGHLSAIPVRDPRLPHPGVMIWGTLEARVQGADLVILAGLNDGIWPAAPAPDPWLNRRMRDEAGLLLPDRRIGLAAHDFQQAIAAPEVVLSRALRDESAETVPSRWLNRLTNLLHGLRPNGPAAVAAMTSRGAAILDLAAHMEAPQPQDIAPPEPRPAPCPPVSARPKALPVTAITTLIRDPYAVYAQRVLRLRLLPPLTPEPDALVRGTALHKVMELFLETRDTWLGDAAAARAALSQAAHSELSRATPHPAMQAFWHARFMAVADRIVAGELARLQEGAPVLTERGGSLPLTGLEFTLTARPDRIDRMTDGRFAIYDYKSGRPKTEKQVDHFDKQLSLEAALMERGGFGALGPGEVARMAYIGLGTSGGELDEIALRDKGDVHRPTRDWDGLHALIAQYMRAEQGYAARKSVETDGFDGDYDHLARLGEWGLTQVALVLPVGEPQ